MLKVFLLKILVVLDETRLNSCFGMNFPALAMSNYMQYLKVLCSACVLVR